VDRRIYPTPRTPSGQTRTDAFLRRVNCRGNLTTFRTPAPHDRPRRREFFPAHQHVLRGRHNLSVRMTGRRFTSQPTMGPVVIVLNGVKGAECPIVTVPPSVACLSPIKYIKALNDGYASFLPLSHMTCRYCEHPHVRRSHRTCLLERVLSVVILPYRCDYCGERFFAWAWAHLVSGRHQPPQSQ
jgi:hypothetical protein